MSVRVSGKQMEIGDSFRARIGEQIEQAVTKYFDGGYSSQVTVENPGRASAPTASFISIRAWLCRRTVKRTTLKLRLTRRRIASKASASLQAEAEGSP